MNETQVEGVDEPLTPDLRPVVVVQPSRNGAASWLIAVSLMVIASCLLLRLDEGRGIALAQPVNQAGARGVFAFTGQLSGGGFGVFMVDLDTTTIWCYEVDSTKPIMRFVASRSWKYDRYLEHFNLADPLPEDVERMVDDQRRRKLQSAGTSP